MRRGERMRELWDNDRTLYSDAATKLIEDDVREALFREFGVIPDDPDEFSLREQIRRHGFIAIKAADVWAPSNANLIGAASALHDLTPGRLKPTTGRWFTVRTNVTGEYRRAVRRLALWIENVHEEEALARAKEHEEERAAARANSRRIVASIWEQLKSQSDVLP